MATSDFEVVRGRAGTGRYAAVMTGESGSSGAPSAPQYSADGQWYWNGFEWLATPPAIRRADLQASHRRWLLIWVPVGLAAAVLGVVVLSAIVHALGG